MELSNTTHRKKFSLSIQKMKKLGALVSCFFISMPSFAQTDFNTQKITFYRDAAQITQKGVLRFENKVCRTSLGLDPILESVDFKGKGAEEISYFKFFEDSVSQKVPAGSWIDLLKANPGREVIIVYQIGTEYDELSGVVRSFNEESGLVQLRSGSGTDFFLPSDQIRQVLLPSGGNARLVKKVPISMVELGIGSDVPFVPVEMNCLHKGMSWEPVCKLHIVSGSEVAFRVSALIQNEIEDFEDIEIDLVGGFVLDGKRVGGSAVSLGRYDLVKGERMVLKLKEEQAKYQRSWTCDIPWKGILTGKSPKRFPANYYLDINVPAGQDGSCTDYIVLDESGRQLGNLDISIPDEQGRSSFFVGDDRQLNVSVLESVVKQSSKLTKTSQGNFYEASIECRISITNNRKEMTDLQLSREFQGSVGEELPEGMELNTNAAGRKVANWDLRIRPNGKKEIVFTYDALIPAID